MAESGPEYPPPPTSYNINKPFNPNNPNFGPPPPPYSDQPPPNFVPNYGTAATTVYITQPEVIIVGGCPACRNGFLEDDFTCLGVLCAIAFFPLGILCCLALREKRCTHCGASFG